MCMVIYAYVSNKGLYTWLQIYNKPSLFQLQLIQMLDNLDRNVKKKLLFTFEYMR
jgi:hypothetical protein